VGKAVAAVVASATTVGTAPDSGFLRGDENAGHQPDLTGGLVVTGAGTVGADTRHLEKCLRWFEVFEVFEVV